jgi:hypothetical protein
MLTTVIIPARRCACRQAARIAAQLGPGDRIVVVRNGPAAPCPYCDGSDQVGVVVTLRYPMPLGAATARNAGAASAPEADILAFTDDDDLVSPDWLGTLIRPLRDGLADLVGGVLLVHGSDEPAVVRPGVDYWHAQALFGANMAVSRVAWDLLGGFDPSFTCCEDTDLAWRAERTGLRLVVALGAVVNHTPRRPRHEFLQRVRWGVGAVRLLRAHGVSSAQLPNLRTLLRHKQECGYCGDPWVAALGQWIGQWLGYLAHLRLASSGKPNTVGAP